MIWLSVSIVQIQVQLQNDKHMETINWMEELKESGIYF